MEHYAELDLPGKTALLRLLGALSLYRDIERLAEDDPAPGPGAWLEAQCQRALILERVGFILRESRMKRGDVLGHFLGIAERALRGFPGAP